MRLLVSTLTSVHQCRWAGWGLQDQRWRNYMEAGQSVEFTAREWIRRGQTQTVSWFQGLFNWCQLHLAATCLNTLHWDQVILQTRDDGHWSANCRMQNKARWLLVQEMHFLHFCFPSRSGTGHIRSLQGSHNRQLRHNGLASAMTSIVAEVCKSVCHLACSLQSFLLYYNFGSQPKQEMVTGIRTSISCQQTTACLTLKHSLKDLYSISKQCRCNGGGGGSNFGV